MLTSMRQNGIPVSSVSGYNFSFANSTLKYDIKLTNGKYIEYKSFTSKDWATNFESKINFEQHLAYLKGTDNWSGFEYRFNPSGYNNIIEVKEAFQNLYKGGKGEEVFEAMWNNTGIRSELWNTIPGGSEAIKKANAKSNFYMLSQNTSSILYRFVN